MALTTIKTGGLADNSVTDAKVADAITITGAQTGITSVGTLSSLTLGGDLSVPQKIIHVGDTDTYLSFGDDSLDIVTGGTTGQTIDHGVLYNYTDLVVAEYIKHDGDTDNYIQFGTDTLTISKETTFSGDVVLSKTSDPWITIKRPNASDQINKIGTDSAGLYFQSYGHATGGNNQIIFMTEESDSSSSPTERMRIESQGSVGVGLNTPQVVRNWTAPDSIKVLNVYGSAGSRVAIQGTDASLDLVDYGATANRRWFSIYNNDDSVFFRRLQDDASSYSDILALNLANGNTTIKGKLTIEVENETPLHIKNTSTAGGNNAYLTIENDGGADTYLNFLQGSSNGYVKYRDEAEMVFQTGGMNDRLTLSSSGAVFAGAIMQEGADTFAHFGREDSDSRIILGSQGGDYSSGSTNAYNNMRAHGGGLMFNTAEADNTFIWEHNGVASMNLIPANSDSTYCEIALKSPRDSGQGCKIRGYTTTDASDFAEILFIRNGSSETSFEFRNHDTGNSTKTTKFYYNGLVYNPSDSSSWNTASDVRIKKDINDLTDAVDVLKKIRPISYKLKKAWTDEKGHEYGRVKNGFIADEYKDVFPNAVVADKNPVKVGNETYDNFLSLDQEDLVPYLVKAVQEMSAKIEALENA